MSLDGKDQHMHSVWHPYLGRELAVSRNEDICHCGSFSLKWVVRTSSAARSEMLLLVKHSALLKWKLAVRLRVQEELCVNWMCNPFTASDCRRYLAQLPPLRNIDYIRGSWEGRLWEERAREIQRRKKKMWTCHREKQNKWMLSFIMTNTCCDKTWHNKS